MSDSIIYLVRHCEATGQEASCSLTDSGKLQAEELKQFFSDKRVDQIMASPFERAIQSIVPTAEMHHLDLLISDDLRERTLSSENLSDFKNCLKETYKDFDLTYSGGESSREALERAMKVISDVKLSSHKATILVSHGNLISLILNHFDQTFGFEEWERLTNPDVYEINLNRREIKRLWKGQKEL
ncbi:histidine phosphatase family protein [Alkalibacillus silvisoli]|uniref:Histidine phosphatase family protein n=1 Tax=Alkalibacillus silvisoli TaxID=392823 RepID=A0ABN0ZLZ9_9BACI